ncbi:thrombospondin-1-like isoform X1 [Styela clava]
MAWFTPILLLVVSTASCVFSQETTQCVCLDYEQKQQQTQEIIAKLEKKFEDKIASLERTTGELLKKSKRQAKRIEELEKKELFLGNNTDGEEKKPMTNGTREWSEWTDWTPCSVTCGVGNKKKVRQCIGPKNGTNNCIGHMKVQLPCKIQCPAKKREERDSDWDEWSEWSACENTRSPRAFDENRKSKEFGIQIRMRKCNIEKCPGKSKEKRECEIECFADSDEYSKQNGYGEWSQWTECKPLLPCNTDTQRSHKRWAVGRQTRSRKCEGVGHCNKELSKTKRCRIECSSKEW